MGVVSESGYRIGFVGAGKLTHKYISTFEEVVDSLKEKGFIVGRDFLLTNFSRGSVLESGMNLVFFEATPSVLKSIVQLDFRVEFSDIFGKRYEKEVYCIPRDGIEKHMDLNW